MGILSSNRYGVGFNDGYADAMAGRSKSYLKATCTLRESGYDSSVEGYNEGYRKGCYDRTNKGNHY